MAAAILDTWSPLALLALVALLLCRNPLRAFRMTLVDVRCARHSQIAPMRCPSCRQDVCHECLIPSARCPHCGQVISPAVTHLVEDGRWVETT